MQTERLDVKVTPEFKAHLAEQAAVENISLGEMIVRATCRWLKFPEEKAVPDRKLPGRKPKLQATKKKGAAK